MQRKKISIRKLVLLGLAVVMMFGLTACGTSQASAGTGADKVRIATQPSLLSSTSLLAKQKGFLDEELEGLGVEAQWTSFDNGPSMNESFAAGQQDIGVLGDVPLILAKANGQETSVFCKAAHGEQTVALVAGADSSIAKPEDLKGKKIGYVVGSYAQHLLYLILQEGGLGFDDIESISLGNADIPAAIEAGEIDAGVIWEPVITSGQNEGRIQVIFDGTGLKRNNVYYNIRTEFAKENPEVAEAYIRAVERAAEFIKENPQEAAEALQGEIDLDVELMAELFQNFDYEVEIDDTDIEQLQGVSDFTVAEELSDNEVDVQEFVDTTYLENK